jgi:hypothetical protein
MKIRITSWLNDGKHALLFIAGALEHEWIMTFQLGMSLSQLTNSYFSEG